MNIFKQYFISCCTLILGCSSYIPSTASASPVTNTYVPTSYTTLNGSDNGHPIQNLQNLNAVGMDLSYPSVEFLAYSAGANYNGYRSYFIPSDSPVTALQVFANYKKAAPKSKSWLTKIYDWIFHIEADTQTWTWQIYDWVLNGWVNIGTNARGKNLGPWTVLNFNVGGPCANYIDFETGEIRIGLISNNSLDDALLNFEAVAVTTDPSAPIPGANYFVATTGADSNSGTSDSPWKTISYAAQVAPAGSTVYVRGGTYSEQVVFQVSGTSEEGPITFMSYPGEMAILDGTNVKLPEAAGAGPSGLLQLTNVNYLVIQGFEIQNIASSSNFVGGIAIEGQCDHLEIRHNHIHDLSSNDGGGHGLSAYGTAAPQGITNLIIDGNELERLALGQSESLTVNGNVQYWTISNNIIHDNNNIGIDAIGAEGTAPSGYDLARDGSIIDNLIYNISDNNNPAYPQNDNSADGIYVDGGASILISGNILHHNNIGIELASEHSGHYASQVVVTSNLIFLNTGAGISLGGYSDAEGSLDQCSIVNNTLYKNDSQMTGSGELQLQYFPSEVSNNIVKNNIFYANKQGVLISNPFSSPIVDLDYNLYHTPNGKSPEWDWNNQSYTSFSKYQSATANDENSIFTDPKIVNTTDPILYLTSTSPAIDAGTNLGDDIEGTADVSGHPRIQNDQIDIGAYER